MQSLSILSITADELRSIIAEAVRETFANQMKAVTAAMPEADELLSREETARILQVALCTLREYELRGFLRPHRIGRRVLYSRRDIRAALAAGRSS